MRESQVNDPVKSAALSALDESMGALLAQEENSDLDWLPDDFTSRILDLAWRHQFDLDKALFRRHIKAYLREVTEEETEA